MSRTVIKLIAGSFSADTTRFKCTGTVASAMSFTIRHTRIEPLFKNSLQVYHEGLSNVRNRNVSPLRKRQHPLPQPDDCYPIQSLSHQKNDSAVLPVHTHTSILDRKKRFTFAYTWFSAPPSSSTITPRATPPSPGADPPFRLVASSACWACRPPLARVNFTLRKEKMGRGRSGQQSHLEGGVNVLLEG